MEYNRHGVRNKNHRRNHEEVFLHQGNSLGGGTLPAEWIAEAPSSTSGVLPLTDFGTAEFGDDYTKVKNTNDATDSTISGPISAFGSTVEEITMVNGSSGADEAVPSSLTTDGSSFTVVWKSE